MLLKGTITGLCGSWGSGLATLVFEDGSVVYCENGPTVRALENCFGNVIGDNHTINNETGGHIGKEIVFTTDFMNILEGFSPYDPEVHDELLDNEDESV
jgi:hypothetical protein